MKTHSTNIELVNEVTQTEFKKDTEVFLKQTIKCYLNAHIDSYIERYYKKDRDTFTGWENLLYGIMKEIEYQIEIGQTYRYPENIIYLHKIKIISQYVDVKKHSINISIINTETNCVLEMNIPLVRYNVTVIAYISVKVGFIVFESGE